MSGNHLYLGCNFKFVENFDNMLHGFPIRPGSHDDANNWWHESPQKKVNVSNKWFIPKSQKRPAISEKKKPSGLKSGQLPG
jgi:hypothetical protein